MCWLPRGLYAINVSLIARLLFSKNHRSKTFFSTSIFAEKLLAVLLSLLLSRFFCKRNDHITQVDWCHVWKVVFWMLLFYRMFSKNKWDIWKKHINGRTIKCRHVMSSREEMCQYKQFLTFHRSHTANNLLMRKEVKFHFKSNLQLRNALKWLKLLEFNIYIYFLDIIWGSPM